MLKNVSLEKQHQMFSDWNKKLETITHFVKSRKEGIYETSAEFLLQFIDFIKLKESIGKYLWLKMASYNGHTTLSFSESRQLMDHAFHANGNCIGCEICQKICPVVHNIQLIKKKPSWKHNCEQCFACLQWCPALAIQLLYISEFFEKNRKDYYDLLNRVSERGDWQNWIRFFLIALTTQSQKTQTTVLKILDLYNNLKGKTTAINSSYAINFLDIIFTKPIISFISIKRCLKTGSNQTIYNLLEKFVKIGVLKVVSVRKRNRIFVFQQLLDILG